MSGPPVGTSVEDVVATVAHAGLERVLELRLGAEALVGPAAEPSGRASDRRLPGGASRGVESQFAALGLVAWDPGGVRIIVGIHGRLVAPHRGVRVEPSLHIAEPPPTARVGRAQVALV